MPASHVVAATVAVLLVGSCGSGDDATVSEWCEQLARTLAAPDDDYEAEMRTLVATAPDEIDDVVAYGLAFETAPSLPPGISGDEADATVDAFLEENCSDELDETFEN